MLTIFPHRSETIEGVGEALLAREISCVEVLQKCLDRIDQWEPRVKAWVVIDREGAIQQAQELDAELSAGRCRGALHGIPFGIKDIIDVRGLPTACGFEPWRDHLAAKDAPAVAALRDSGAVMLGKTVTTQFAWIDPAATRNPWNLQRTPGGSSSGSAAAVATGMCLAALGTQTGGSVIRPASFCGVVGYKFEHDDRLLEGIHPFAKCLDHLGIFARSTRDAAHVAAFIRYPTAVRNALWSSERSSKSRPWIEKLDSFEELNKRKMRILLNRGFFERRADPEMLDATERAARILAEAGAELIEGDESDVDYEGVLRKHRLIMAVGAAAVHESLYREHAEKYSPHIGSLIEEGLKSKATDYARERDAMEEGRLNAINPGNGLFPGSADAILTPATIGPAPDASTTGNPCMNSPWSYFGLPVTAIPVALSREGLPLSIQLTGPSQPGPEEFFFQTAAWCESAIRRADGAGSD